MSSATVLQDRKLAAAQQHSCFVPRCASLGIVGAVWAKVWFYSKILVQRCVGIVVLWLYTLLVRRYAQGLRHPGRYTCFFSHVLCLWVYSCDTLLVPTSSVSHLF